MDGWMDGWMDGKKERKKDQFSYPNIAPIVASYSSENFWSVHLVYNERVDRWYHNKYIYPGVYESTNQDDQ